MADHIVVIGGSGFIGTRLVRQLQAAGHNVRIVDKAASAAFPDLVTLCDVRDEAGLVDACAGADVIYNLAAEHRDDVRPISLYDEVNVEGARKTCVAAAKNDVQRIVFTSSVAVYGFSDGNTDESGYTRPFNDYGRTKLAAEGVLEEWADADPARSLTIVRPTVVFGEDNRGNVYNLLRQIAEGPFLMIGDGTNKKSMAYVENVAGFLAFALGAGPGRHVYNYIDKPDYDMNVLVATIRRALGRKEKASLRMPYGIGYAAGLLADGVAAVIRRPLPFSRIRVQKFCASTVFASDKMRATGYEPPFALDDALSRTIEHEFGGGGAAS
jgi:nucleoside-diphosphate-sugar epimerase